jgi:hypothetical protein
MPDSSPFVATALTSYFARQDEPDPHDIPLCNAPVANANLALPANGVNFLFGRGAPRVISQAMQRAIKQGYRPFNATVALQFHRVSPSTTFLESADLAATELLVLEKTRITVELAREVQDYLAAYLAERQIHPALKRSAIFFDLVAAYPHLLEQLVKEPRYAHLKGIVYNLPGTAQGPASRLLYLRDLNVITRIQTLEAAGRPVFRLPTPDEMAQPPRLYNPFLDRLAPAAATRSTAARDKPTLNG